MPDVLLRGVEVRPIRPDERDLFDASLGYHHWLGSSLAGRTMRYVATGEDGRWLALPGFGGGALSCKLRDEYIGGSREQQNRRLPHIPNNQRFSVLPAGRHPNLASLVLTRTLRRLSDDYRVQFGFSGASRLLWWRRLWILPSTVAPATSRAGFSALDCTAGYTDIRVAAGFTMATPSWC